ncbi:MAG: hypothetical protein BWX75_00339 [Candidatus Cloacimonetes bacterium ADurb.Bin088]|jgi:hypothetical protein|nr:MAG: hypothetical protein BWX75_00339 [Candidatus Cloacimonetes bacterium ADurb.Bin088]
MKVVINKSEHCLKMVCSLMNNMSDFSWLGEYANN